MSPVYTNPLRASLGTDFFKTIPQSPGVYFMHDARGTLLYVGKAKNLRKRLLSYTRVRPDTAPERTLELVERIAEIRWQICRTESEALIREGILLRSEQPSHNIVGTDDEPYLYIGLDRRSTGERENARVGFLLSRTGAEPGTGFLDAFAIAAR